MVTKKVELREVKNGFKELTLTEEMGIFQAETEVSCGQSIHYEQEHQGLKYRCGIIRLEEQVFEDGTGKVGKTRSCHPCRELCILAYS